MSFWIDVNERLPAHNEDVLVFAIGKTDGFIGDSQIAITGIYNHKSFPSSPDNWGWSAPWQYFHSNYTITHWMPLPDAPTMRGTWMRIDDYSYDAFECDRCGTIVEEQFKYLPKYCPDCGAKMDGGADGAAG